MPCQECHIKPVSNKTTPMPIQTNQMRKKRYPCILRTALSPRIPIFVQSQGSRTMKRLSRDLSFLMDGPILIFVKAKLRILTLALFALFCKRRNHGQSGLSYPTYPPSLKPCREIGIDSKFIVQCYTEDGHKRTQCPILCGKLFPRADVQRLLELLHSISSTP